MTAWIEEVAQREAELIRLGVPAAEAMRVASLFADALAQADKAKRNAERRRSKLSATVDMCRHIGTSATARELGVSPQAIRKRRMVWFNENATAEGYRRLR